MGLEWTPSERARHARAELEAIVASLRGAELAELVRVARALLDRKAGALDDVPQEGGRRGGAG
jgi:hypothetical protein